MLDFTTLIIYIVIFSLYFGGIICYFIFGGDNKSDNSLIIKYDDYKNFEESDEEMIDNKRYIKYHQLNSVGVVDV